MSDQRDNTPAGEEVEDVVEQIISDTSPSEDTTTHGGDDAASRDGERAVPDADDEPGFTA